MSNTNTIPNQHNSIPTDTEGELTADRLKEDLVQALKPYSAKEIKDNFQGFVPDKFVDGNTIGHKNTVSAKRRDFSEQIIKCIDEYSEKKITEAFSTKNKPLDTGTKAKFRKYVHHHLLTYKAFQTKTCDMIIDELISPLLENKLRRSSDKNSTKTVTKRKEHDLEPYGTIKCFPPNIDIPDILKNPLSTETINETSTIETIAHDVLFPVLKYIIFPKCPFELRKAMVWKQRVTRIINFAVCSTLILKYQNHNQLEQDIKDELKRMKLPPWWCVSCFYNTYKLSEANEKNQASSQNNSTSSSSHLSLSTNRPEEWKTFQKTLHSEYIHIHNALYNKVNKFWSDGTVDAATNVIWKPNEDGFQELKMDIKMKRPPAFQDVPDLLYKYKKYYLNGIFDEGWANIIRVVKPVEQKKDRSSSIDTTNNDDTDPRKETTDLKTVKIVKCKHLSSTTEVSIDIKTLSTTELTFEMLPSPVTNSNDTTTTTQDTADTSQSSNNGNTTEDTADTPLTNNNDNSTEDTAATSHTNNNGNTTAPDTPDDEMLRTAGKDGVHLFEHLILDKVLKAHILDRSVFLKRFARGR